MPGWIGGKYRDVAFENSWAAQTQGWINPITARMSEMDPNMFYKGWAWTSKNLLINYAVRLLNLYTFDLIIKGHWIDLNLGRFIEESNMIIELKKFEDPHRFGETVTFKKEITYEWGGKLWQQKIVVGEASHTLISQALWESAKTGGLEELAFFTGAILHEAAHVFLGTLGFHGSKYEYEVQAIEFEFYYMFLGFIPKGRAAP